MPSITTLDPSVARVVRDGKFLRCGQERFLVKGVAYGRPAEDLFDSSKVLGRLVKQLDLN